MVLAGRDPRCRVRHGRPSWAVQGPAERILRNAGVTMLLAEQKVDLALAFAEDALVLERGRIAFRGKTAELREDEALQHRLLAIGEAHRLLSPRNGFS